MEEKRMMQYAPPQTFAELEALARECWHSAYDDTLLTRENVDYMLNLFQTVSAMEKQVREDGYIYFFLMDAGEKVGYCALQPQGERLFLSKLYLKASARGKGLGQRALGEVISAAERTGAKSVWLTVNKGNARAVRAYEKFGFVRSGEGVSDIGQGYVMDDYYYEYFIAGQNA